MKFRVGDIVYCKRGYGDYFSEGKYYTVVSFTGMSFSGFYYMLGSKSHSGYYMSETNMGKCFYTLKELRREKLKFKNY